jgi:hypothetical protein
LQFVMTRPQFPADPLPLEDADAVHAGEPATEFERPGEDLLGGLPRLGRDGVVDLASPRLSAIRFRFSSSSTRN